MIDHTIKEENTLDSSESEKFNENKSKATKG